MKAKEKLRILIVSPTFGRFGGIESFVFALADCLQTHPEIESVQVRLKKIGPDPIAGLLSEYLEKRQGTAAVVRSWSRDLYRAISGSQFVHCQNAALDVALFSKIAGVPLGLTIHNWRRTGFKPQFAARRVAFSLARRRWYNSDFVWDTWEPRGRLPTSGKPPLVSDLPTGVVPPERRRGFIFVSRWVPRKGLEVLLDAYEQADLDRARWPLVLVGDGTLRPRIEERLRDRPIPGVSVAGAVDTPTRNELIRTSRWLVAPPHTQEDLGLTPIEARHVGVPCIITRDGGLPEAGGKFALVCEPADVGGLKALLERAARMGEEEYNRIADETRRELLDSLQPLTVYPRLYREAIHGPANGIG